MSRIEVQDRLEYARCGVAVLRALEIKNTTMTYGEFGRAIGLIADIAKWEARHRQQVEEILQLAAAAERQHGGGASTMKALNYTRVVAEKTGKLGSGVDRNSRVVRTKPA